MRHAIVHALSRQVVFQLDGNHRDAIDRQHHIDAVLVLFRIMPLTDALANVLPIMFDGLFIEGGFRLEIADLEIHAAMPEAMTENGDKTIRKDSIFKAFVELAQRIRIALALETLPHDRLCFFDEYFYKTSSLCKKFTSCFGGKIISDNL